MDQSNENGRAAFVEQFGILFEKMGFPRAAGRIWGWLLTCNPAHQSAGQIEQAVGASRGSVSTMTRLLMEMGAVEKVGLPGQRSGYYRVRTSGFADMLRVKMKFTAEVRKMAERGLETLRVEPPEIRRRLEEYRDMCAFFERELPMLIEKWEEVRTARYG